MGPQNWTLDPTPKTPLDRPPRNSLCTVFCWENQHLHREFGRLSPLLDPPARVPPKFFMQIFFGCFFRSWVSWWRAQCERKRLSRKCAINNFGQKIRRGGWGEGLSRGSRQIIYVRIFPNIWSVFGTPNQPNTNNFQGRRPFFPRKIQGKKEKKGQNAQKKV